MDAIKDEYLDEILHNNKNLLECKNTLCHF